MSDLAPGRAPDVPEGPFRARTVLVLLAVGIVGFVGMLVLGAYAPSLRPGRDGGAHALSVAATGYAGLVRLVDATGGHARVIRDERGLLSEDLLVLTPGPEDGAALAKLVRRRGRRATLVVLPKWSVVADPANRAWVRRAGSWSDTILPDDFAAFPGAAIVPRLTVRRVTGLGRPLVATGQEALPGVAFRAAAPLQTIAAPGLVPLLTDRDGRIVLGRAAHGLYLLADPDLLANWRLRDAGTARSALALLAALNSGEAETTGFDVTLNGLGRTPSLLRLAFDPPFLAVTLTLAAALLLAGLHALGRFGPPQRRARAVAFGKAALLDNAAALVRMARRETVLGTRYAAALRERAGAAAAAPPALRDAALDDYLDRLGRPERFSLLARAVEEARDRHALLAAARALHAWGERTA